MKISDLIKTLEVLQTRWGPEIKVEITVEGLVYEILDVYHEQVGNNHVIYIGDDS